MQRFITLLGLAGIFTACSGKKEAKSVQDECSRIAGANSVDCRTTSNQKDGIVIPVKSSPPNEVPSFGKPTPEPSHMPFPDQGSNQGSIPFPFPKEGPGMPFPEPTRRPIPAPNPPPAVDVQFEFPAQFWLYREMGHQLTFNNPWDKTPGDAIKRSSAGVPSFAIECLRESRDALAQAESNDGVNWRGLARLGVTNNMMFLVNVVSRASHLQALRKMDREPYLWIWSRKQTRPLLSTTDFKQGTFVWEVVASPEGCLQPNVNDAKRYVEYVYRRMTIKK